MPSNEQRRQAAKRKLERQLANRASRAKRRRMITVISSVVAVVVVVGGIYLLVTTGQGNPTAAAAAASSSTVSSTPTTTTNPGVPTNGPCKYTTTPSQPAPAGKNVGVPQDPNPTPKTGTVTVTLHTNFGDLPLTLNPAQAPCTVQSFAHLASTKYFDNTICHRETAYPTLKVLQCGDPTGQGTGGPGYTIPDENPTGLKAAPTTPNSTAGNSPSSIYPRGVIAMANTGQPNSGGSQFFLVYGDSQLPPNYAVFGTVGSAGLATLDKIVSNGITPGSDPSTGQPTPQDGKPKQTVTIQQAQVS